MVVKSARKKIQKIVNKYYFLYCFFKAKTIGPNATLDRLVDFVFKDCGKVIAPSQIRSEILGLLKILYKMKPRRIIEIGTLKGGTLFLFSRIAAVTASIITIDLPGGQFGGGYSAKRRPFLYRSFARRGQKIHLIRANSHDKATMEKVNALVMPEEIDFLFIDGDHSYEGVKTDFERYSELVRKGGVIALHDIVRGRSENVGGVPKFWNEIKEKYNCTEIIDNPKQEAYGIGVLYM